jgi:hypothetical protein
MSTKTIAVDARIHARLAAAKREDETFSETIDRLLGPVDATSPENELVLRSIGFPPPTREDFEAILVAEN